LFGPFVVVESLESMRTS